MLEIQKQNHKDLSTLRYILLMQTSPCLNVPIPAIHESKIFLIVLVPGGKGQIQL